MRVWAGAWDPAARAVRTRVSAAVSLKVARAGALLMAVEARVTAELTARTLRVMDRVAVIATVEVARNMAEVVVMAMTVVMTRVTAEARAMDAMEMVRVKLMAPVAVMAMAKADRATDTVARTMARVVRAMAVDAARARARATARDSPISTVTATAVVTV